jgi:hypothetical protein
VEIKVFVLKGKELTGRCRKLPNEELHILYLPPNIKVIKTRRMRWAEHVANMRQEMPPKL